MDFGILWGPGTNPLWILRVEAVGGMHSLYLIPSRSRHQLILVCFPVELNGLGVLVDPELQAATIN